jgi:hypothetical protein
MPKNNKGIKTAMGNGKGSTTMAPKACQTRIGCIWDLPGDEDTGGPIAELINSISKKNMGKVVKNIKIMIIVPESALGP